MDAQRAVARRSGGPNVASSQNGSRWTGTVSIRSRRKPTEILPELVPVRLTPLANTRGRART